MRTDGACIQGLPWWVFGCTFVHVCGSLSTCPELSWRDGRTWIVEFVDAGDCLDANGERAASLKA